MKHAFRFLGERLDAKTWSLDSNDQQHIKRVLRLASGDEIEAGNGKGGWARGLLREDLGGLYLQVEEAFFIEPPKPVILILGALKHGEFDELIAPLTEVGVTECRLFLQPGSEKTRLADKAQKRWCSLQIAAMKQAKCPWLMGIKVFGSLELAASDLGAIVGEDRYYLYPGKSSLLQSDGPHSDGIALVVGSEKGFAESEERWLLDHAFRPTSIGPHILRAKTAAVLAGGLGALRVLNSN
jgi:16S rRNA (uracil1498-N3)-methyltransferase